MNFDKHKEAVLLSKVKSQWEFQVIREKGMCVTGYQNDGVLDRQWTIACDYESDTLNKRESYL